MQRIKGANWGGMVSYTELGIYSKGYKLAIKIHQITMGFPRHELYEIGSQLRRAAISIPLNIAEGYGRKTYLKDFIKFLINAMGSCNEVSVLLDMIKDLGYIEISEYNILKEDYDHLGRQINRLIKSIKYKY